MLLTDDTHFVNGMKMTRQDPPHRVFIGNLHRFVTRWSFWLPINDVDCDFRLIRRSILDKIGLRSNSGSICVELVKQAQRAGAQFREVSVHHYARRSGVSRVLHATADPPHLLRSRRDVGRADGRGQTAGSARSDRIGRVSTAAGAGADDVPRLLSRPPGDDHRRARLHRQQPRPSARRSRRARADRRLAHLRVRRQPVQHPRHRRPRDA